MPKLFATTPATFESWFVQKKGKNKEKGKKPAGEGELEPDAAEVLHEILRPFFLRRTKEEVLKDLPPKSEIILYSGIFLIF
jgi:SNF2 family DNA or RNA helicase